MGKLVETTGGQEAVFQIEEVGLAGEILADLRKAAEFLGLAGEKVAVEHPKNPGYGDFSSNVALVFFPEKGKELGCRSAVELAQKLAEEVKKLESPLIGRVEAVAPGFVNLWLKDGALVGELKELLTKKEGWGQLQALQGKKVLLEHTSPDPIKTIHVGHLRNNFLGMAVGRILAALGAEVKLDCVNNDRGTHVARAMFGYLVFARKKLGWPAEELVNFKITDEKVNVAVAGVNWQEMLDGWLTEPAEWWQPEDLKLKTDHLNLIFYSLGDRSERLVPEVKEQVRAILQAWEAGGAKVRALWRRIIDWSLSGYAVTYRRVGSHFDKVWSESELYQEGKELVAQGLARGVFKESKGAVVTDLAAYRLPDTVAQKSDGTAIYLTFDINLTKQKKAFFPADKYIWDIGNDQVLYMRQLFAVCEQLGIGERGEFYHLNFAYVYLKSGERMSSRQGTVITGDELLDFVKSKAQRLVQMNNKGEMLENEIEETAEKIGQAALKYAFLSTTRGNEVFFDPETSVSFSGNSGPYLQYTFARCQSVLKKAVEKKVVFSLSEYDLFRGKKMGLGEESGEEMLGGMGGMPFGGFGGFGQPAAKNLVPSEKKQPKQAPVVNFLPAEKDLLRFFYRYPEVLAESGRRLEPAFLANFLFDLAQKYNYLYNQHSILGLTEEEPEEGEDAPVKEEEFEEEELLAKTKAPKDDVFFRLSLTAAVGQILAVGLQLLGIEPLEKM